MNKKSRVAATKRCVGRFGSRKSGIAGNTDFDAQLNYVLKEINNEASPGAAQDSARLLREAITAEEGARAATAFERAEHYDRETHTDDWTAKTLRGIPGVNTAAPAANPFAHWDPNFDQKLKVFKDAKPLGSERHSMNEIHDHRSVANDVNINVIGASPADLTARPLSRPRNADLIRNTAAYAV